MSKTMLIEDIMQRADGLAKKDVQKVLEAFVESVQDNVATGVDVNLTGFGRFTRVERSARTGRNPQTGVEIRIPAAKVPSFKAGKVFKDKVNG
ncbi:MAG TPA: HU family DNA-binding protein [Nitrococcus sp.]|nr:HU family DNA-binding protein [Nitrococcus sp.]